jgi:hypothetical protein
MFEIFGIICAWFIGAALSAYLPILTVGLWGKSGEEGLESCILAFWFGCGFLLAYVVVTIAYLAAT